MSRVFVTGGSGVVGRSLVERLVGGGDEVVALARSPEAEAKLTAAGAVATVRGDIFDDDALASGMDGCATVFHVAGVNSLCVDGPARRCCAPTSRGRRPWSRPRRARGWRGSSTPRRRRRSAKPPGAIGREDSPHRGWYLSVVRALEDRGRAGRVRGRA